MPQNTGLGEMSSDAAHPSVVHGDHLLALQRGLELAIDFTHGGPQR